MGEFGEVLGVRPQNPRGYVTAPAGQRPLRRNEFQCPCCDRVFTSDALCEAHKTYRVVDEWGSEEVDCADPASLGLVSEKRGGLEVWMTPEGLAKAERGRISLDGYRHA